MKEIIKVGLRWLKLAGQTLVAVTATLPAVASTPSEVADPLANYYSNSLICLDNVTHATCHIWFGNVWKTGDHRYLTMWDRGPQSELPTVGGNFRIEGREGTYRLQGGGKICLMPQSDPQKNYRMAQDDEFYASAGCYEIAAHQIGDSWTQRDQRGRSFTFWLL